MDWSYFFSLHLDTNSSRAKGSRWQVLLTGFGISKAQLGSRYSRFLPYSGRITTLLLSIRKRYIILQGFLNNWVHSPDWGSGNSGKSSVTQKTILEKCKAQEANEYASISTIITTSSMAYTKHVRNQGRVSLCFQLFTQVTERYMYFLFIYACRSHLDYT